jgi:hypothetical protein
MTTESLYRKAVAALAGAKLIRDGKLVAGWGHRVNLPASANQYTDVPRNAIGHCTADELRSVALSAGR